MDSLTHIYFADKLLCIAGGNITASVCSLFPQIDREPAYYHRMYGHPFFQIRRLAGIGVQVYSTGILPPEHENEYDWKRFMYERTRMMHFARSFQDETGVSVAEFDADEKSVLLAYVSHTYQDIFNNPMQGFLPRSVYPCGMWSLWSELDPIYFRTILYAPENIAEFRAEFFSNSIWSCRIEADALIVAMVQRTAISSIVNVPETVVHDAVISLGIEHEFKSPSIQLANEFLIEHEHLLAKLIRKYSTSSRPSNYGGAPHPTPS